MIGFIGAGAMGGAIIRGAIASENFSADDVVVSGSSPEAAAASAQALGVSAAGSNADLVTKVGAGIVVLAVKPQVLPHVLPGIREEAGKHGTVIVSIAAGTIWRRSPRLWSPASQSFGLCRTWPPRSESP